MKLRILIAGLLGGLADVRPVVARHAALPLGHVGISPIPAEAAARTALPGGGS